MPRVAAVAPRSGGRCSVTAGALPRTIGVVGPRAHGRLARARGARRRSRRCASSRSSRATRCARSALADGVADEARAAPARRSAAATLAVLCTPVAAIEALLGAGVAPPPRRRGATDVGGAKERVVAAARAAVRPGVAFVGAHPMFGGHGGYAGASAEHWKGGTVAVCTDGARRPRSSASWRCHAALGAKVVRCAAAEHDAAVAMVSHLPVPRRLARSRSPRARRARSRRGSPGRG